MDSFEQVVATVLDRAGYWVRTSVKVALTADEKREIGRPSAPRWEIDVVAYSAKHNDLLVVECKSYLDSYGVRATSFEGTRAEDETRYKLFHDDVLRRVVLTRLETQLADQGFCPDGTRATLCLAAGKIYGDPAALHEVFKKNGWRLFDTRWLTERLRRLSDESYDNSVASVVAKLLLRNVESVRSKSGVAARRVSEREQIMPAVRRDLLVAALYLSRFGHEALGLGNQDETLEEVSARLGAKKHTLKNYRDHFDPHTESKRRGWWQVTLPNDLRELLTQYRSFSEPELRAQVLELLDRAVPTAGYSTQPGFMNRNGQVVVRATGLPGTDHGQSIYVLHCNHCTEEYGANGSDIWLRACPRCQRGKPGLSFQLA